MEHLYGYAICSLQSAKTRTRWDGFRTFELWHLATGELEAAENFGPGPELISSDTDTDWQRLGEEKNWKMGSRGPVTSNYFQI